MWYFAWILGVLLACSFGIINALWLESSDAAALESGRDHEAAEPPCQARRRPGFVPSTGRAA